MGLGVLTGGLRNTGSSLLRSFTPGVLPAPQFKHLKAFPVRQQVRMVEGPQCHRVANVHRKVLKGHAFKAVSPNKRFTDGAKLINGKILHRIEVHGKNLFYFFGEGSETVVMHIHFGMSGRFRVSPLPGPEATPTTRLSLTNDTLGVVANLSAMTVQHGGLEFYEEQSGKIGPDPLREDADIELVWHKMNKSKKPVGLVLMDQSMVAGIGNIYRAEILFKAGVHPEQPGNTVERDAFERIWRHSVLLLQRGFKEGSILTVDPAEAKILGPPWTRRYIYNHPNCGRCKTAVGVWDMAARTVYACPTCQPLTSGTALTPARSQALEKAHAHKKFKSTCAPDGPLIRQPVMPPAEVVQLSVADLKNKLKSLGESTKGKKDELQARLATAVAKEATEEEATVNVPQKDAMLSAVEDKPGADVKKVEAGRGKRARRATVKAESSEPPVEPVKKRRKAKAGVAKAAKQEPKIKSEEPMDDNLSVEGLAVEGISVSGLIKEKADVPGDEKPPKPAKGKAKKQSKAKGKAFDSVLDKEDREGPVVVTSAGEEVLLPAPGLPEQDQWDGLTVAMLKHELQRRNLSTKGIKHKLVDRLREAVASNPNAAAGDVKPGIAGIHAVATREEAEDEKRRAGEGKNVEHVAL